jgi:hypothetical protein
MMSLPGFRAQRSLYRMTGHYLMAASFDHTQGIIAQKTTCGPCY